MEFVRQRDRMDCGVACTAMLCGVSYEEAWKQFAWKPSQYTHGLTTKDIREAAERLGYITIGGVGGRLLPCGPTRWEAIPSRSLVKIPHPTRPGVWHWVVWHRRKVYDPARGVFRLNKYDWVPTSYLRFERK